MSANVSEFRDALLAITPNLRAYARSLCGAADAADDLVQDTLLRAWEKQDALKSQDKLQAWTMTIMRNEFFAQCRRSKFSVDDADGHYADSLVSNAQQEVSADLRDLADVLAKMDDSYRECLVLIFVNELSYEEAASVAGCPVGTMKSRVHRARTELCKKLGLETDGRAGTTDNQTFPGFGHVIKAQMAQAHAIALAA